MANYMAKIHNTGIFLSRDSQLDEYLGQGASIYELENGEPRLIATPEDGFLGERPQIEKVKVLSLNLTGDDSPLRLRADIDYIAMMSGIEW